MYRRRIVALLVGLVFLSASLAFSEPGQVLKIVINGDINPVSAAFIVENIDRAEKGKYECLLIQMDTPGGLLESTKTIVKKMLSADVPVVIYVAPSGSGAVSAGVFIALASHIAVMAEGTNIGAAHPVGIGGQQDTSKVMKEKVTNWASAWIHGIAEKRGRNAAWAEKAVRESISTNEKEALKLHIIDLICPNQDSLLHAIDGRTVTIESGSKTLATKNATVVVDEMSWRDKILYRISNPNIAYILLILGIYGLFFELFSPGAVVPGVVGGICIILAFFALQTLPLSSAGLLLILFAIILFVLEVKVTSYGVLSIGGAIALFLGSIMLYEEIPGFPISVDWRIALTLAIATGLFFAFALGMALKARVSQPTTGREGLIGEKGVAVTAIEKEGQVRLHGELWKAYSEETIKEGDRVRVVAVDGLAVKVMKLT